MKAPTVKGAKNGILLMSDRETELLWELRAVAKALCAHVFDGEPGFLDHHLDCLQDALKEIDECH